MSGADRPRQGGFPAIEELMPHRGPVVLIDRVLAHDAESTEVRVSVEEQRWLKHQNGYVAGWLAVEYMAQCVAAREGLLALDEGRPPPVGYLVGVSRLRLECVEFPADAVLCVSSRRVRGRPSLGALSHQCRLYLDSHFASGKSSVRSPRGESPVEAGSSGAARGRLLADGRLSVSVPRGALG